MLEPWDLHHVLHQIEENLTRVIIISSAFVGGVHWLWFQMNLIRWKRKHSKKRTKNLKRRCEILLCLAFREGTFSLGGVVKDQNGASIIGATVTVTNIATGKEFKAIASGQGTYSFPLLAPGTYEVSVGVGGFPTANATVMRIILVTQTGSKSLHGVATASSGTQLPVDLFFGKQPHVC